MEKIKPPKAKFEVSITTRGSDEQEVISAMRHFLWSFQSRGVHSFVSSEGVVEVEVNEGLTRDEYERQLNEYLRWETSEIEKGK